MRVAAMTPTKYLSGYSAYSANPATTTTTSDQPPSSELNSPTKRSRQSNRVLFPEAPTLAASVGETPGSPSRRSSSKNLSHPHYSPWLIPFLLVLAVVKFTVLTLWGLSRPFLRSFSKTVRKAMQQSTAEIIATPRPPRRRRDYLYEEEDEVDVFSARGRTANSSSAVFAFWLKLFYAMIVFCSLLMAYSSYRAYVRFVAPLVSFLRSDGREPQSQPMNEPSKVAAVIPEEFVQRFASQQRSIEAINGMLSRAIQETTARLASLEASMQRSPQQQQPLLSPEVLADLESRLTQSIKQELLLSLSAHLPPQHPPSQPTTAPLPGQSLPLDYALASLGARVIESQTSPPYEASPQSFLSRLLGRPHGRGRPPIFALHVPQ